MKKKVLNVENRIKFLNYSIAITCFSSISISCPQQYFIKHFAGGHIANITYLRSRYDTRNPKTNKKHMTTFFPRVFSQNKVYSKINVVYYGF